jgi:hypothetical protein
MEKNILEKFINNGVSIRKIAYTLKVSSATIKYWITKHNLKIKNNDKLKEKTCPNCLICKPSSEFYRRRKNSNLSSYCKVCTGLQTTQRQHNLKKLCVEYKGGKCSECGYNKYIGALEFHHINPDEKDFEISRYKRYVFNDKLKYELDQCKLMCSNCHKEEHEKIRKVKLSTNTNLYKNLNIDEDFKFNNIELDSYIKTKNITKYCPICNKEMKYPINKHCSYECVALASRRFNPSKEELEKLVWEMPTLKVAEYYGVSDVAISKRCKKLGINKPPRGYWAKHQAI